MIAVKSNNVQQPRLVSAEGSLSSGTGTPLTIIQQKPNISLTGSLLQTQQQQQQQQQLLQRPKLAVTSPTAVKSVDNKTCRWKFENGQICGKVFTKTYNLTVHMRMHQDIRPFPCTICEQTFRQKAHLQRHEATHGIDSTAGRKRRKKSLLDGMEGMGVGGRRMSESEEEESVGGEEAEIYRRSFADAKRKFTVGTVMKTEAGTGDLELDPMIEPIEGSGSGVRKLCPITVGTNTEAEKARGKEAFVDELEEDMEPVRYRREAGQALQVEQGVQYCEADLLDQSELQPQEVKFVPSASIDAPQVAAMQTQVSMSELMGEESGVEKAVLKVEGETVFSSQGQQQHYVEQEQEQQYMEEEELVGEEAGQQHQLIDSDGSYIDASTNQIVMNGDGGLVRLVSMNQGENVVNIVTSTATNEHGQQIVIIENLDQHSPELQREIMRALLADPSIVPSISTS